MVMDVLPRLLSLASEAAIIGPVGNSPILHRCSLYGDEVVLFLSPTQRDIRAHLAILDFFGAVLGLNMNLAKCAALPICCSENEINTIREELPCGLVSFPTQYLGIPLTTGCLQNTVIAVGG